jgi:hypothetical protein
MILSDLQFALPLSQGNFVFFPIVRQVLARTTDWFAGVATPVALLILEDETLHLTILDDGVSHHELLSWLKVRGVVT